MRKGEIIKSSQQVVYINRLKYKKLCISDKKLKFSLNCLISSLLFTFRYYAEV